MSVKGSLNPWLEEHDIQVLRGIVQIVLANRSTIYKIPELADVANHGGDRINARIKQMLIKLEGIYTTSHSIVKEEIAHASAGRMGERKALSESGSPSKSMKVNKGGVTKKKISKASKVKVEIKGEEEDELFSEGS